MPRLVNLLNLRWFWVIWVDLVDVEVTSALILSFCVLRSYYILIKWCSLSPCIWE